MTTAQTALTGASTVLANEADWGRALGGARPYPVDDRRLADIFLLAQGAFAPLTGFLGRAATESVLDTMRLPTGQPWTIPVLFPLFQPAVAGEKLALAGADGQPVAVLEVEEVFDLAAERFNQKVYGTTELKHPGARLVAEGPARYAAGRVLARAGWRPPGAPAGYPITPAETRALFAARGWRRVTAFQTRNPIHRAHEFCVKTALETSDGVMIHPLVGETKADDIPATVRLRCYETLLREYFPADRALLALYPAWMRYAGPREAIFHALVRRNYGCTHFIVGRDHAGVAGYYGPFDSQQIFSRFAPGELG
ncbi:MAG: hypothetical protein ACRD2E_15510, partial [Terriglobales bacterium]